MTKFKFKCDVCNKKFATKKGKEDHNKTKHPSGTHGAQPDTTPTCPICDKPFATLLDLSAHTEDKHVPNYYCVVCKTGRLTVAELQSHNREKHPT